MHAVQRMQVCGAYVAQVFDDPALQKAKVAVEKGGSFVKREAMFLQRSALANGRFLSFARMLLCMTRRPMVKALVQLGRDRPESELYPYLFLVAYCFLLRLPSEALPMQAGDGDFSLRTEGALALSFLLCLLHLAVFQEVTW